VHEWDFVALFVIMFDALASLAERATWPAASGPRYDAPWADKRLHSVGANFHES
jgi:hypothetical protein